MARITSVNILSRFSVTIDGVRLAIGFINHLQIVTTAKCSTVTDFHTTNHSTLIYCLFPQVFTIRFLETDL
jgi:hypothetical protein